MKKIYSFISMLLLPAAVAVTHAQTAGKTSSASFGRLGGDCSSGRGVCSFNSNNVLATGSTERSARKLTETSFVLKIVRSVISGQDEMRILGKPFADLSAQERPTFTQTDALTLDVTSLGNLGLNTEYNKILPGSYPLSVLSDTIEITFTLSK